MLITFHGITGGLEKSIIHGLSPFLIISDFPFVETPVIRTGFFFSIFIPMKSLCNFSRDSSWFRNVYRETSFTDMSSTGSSDPRYTEYDLGVNFNFYFHCILSYLENNTGSANGKMDPRTRWSLFLWWTWKQWLLGSVRHFWGSLL